MIFSQEKSFVYVAVPKTGTTSIEAMLRDVDPCVVRNRVLDARGEWQKVPTHATAAELRRVMGPRASHYTFVAFFRDPRELIRSKYFFYCYGRPAQAMDRGLLTLSKRPGDGRVALALALRVWFARRVPLSLWAALYPFTSGAKFVLDAHGRVAVDLLGDYADLAGEVRRIFAQFGYSQDDLQLPRANVTDYTRPSTEGEWLERIVRRKLAADIAVYDLLRAGRLNSYAPFTDCP